MSARVQVRQEAGALLTVERGLQVLRAFRSDSSPLTNAELVRRSRLSKATVSRLTSTLVQLGYLRRAEDGRAFEVAARPVGVGHAFVTTSELLHEAQPFMQALADRLGVSVALAVGDGLDMLYVAYRASHRVATLRLGVGSVLPMGTTSIGHAYLSALPLRQQRSLIAELKRRAESGAAALESGIRASFAELEETGTCGVLGGYQRDAYGVALPVFVGRDRVVMGLSCGKAEVQPDLATQRQRIAPVLKEAAVQFEELMSRFDGSP